MDAVVMTLKRYACYIFIFCLGVYAWVVQSSYLCNPDVSWFVEASRRMLAGGSYTKDFFENNPPWIFYFNIPAVLLEKLFDINQVNAIRIYVFFLIFISLGISNFLLQRIFSKEDKILAFLFLSALTITFFIFPQYEFGQREHLLYILSMPYILMMALRLQNAKIKPTLAIVIGALSGSVFILKPYFLATVFFLEFYYIFTKKNLNACLRPEIFTLFGLLAFYLALVLIRHADYFNVVIPHVIHWVYLGAASSWSSLAENMWVTWSFFAALFYLATYSINRYKSLSAVLMISLGSFLFSYFAQYTEYAYRILPTASLVQVIFVFFFGMYITTAKKTLHVYFLMALTTVILCLFCFLNHYFQSIFYYAYIDPSIFFGEILVLFFMMVFLQKNYRITPSASYLKIIGLPLLITYIFFITITSVVGLSIMLTVMTCLLLILGFCLLFPDSLENKANLFLMTVLAILVFSAPLFYTQNTARYDKLMKQKYDPLIAYLNANASGQYVYIFTTMLTSSCSVIAHTKNTLSASRLSGFWLLSGLMKQHYIAGYKNLDEQQIKDKNFLIAMAVEDIQLKKPKLLLFDDKYDKDLLSYGIRQEQNGGEQFFNIPYDFINDFSNNDQFRNVLKNYHFLTTLEEDYVQKINPFLYDFQIAYHRIPKDNEVFLDNHHQKFFLYIDHDGDLAILIRKTLDTVARLKIDSNKNGLSPQQITAIKEKLSIPGAQLTQPNRQAILAFLAKQYLPQQFYRFKIYERNNVWR